MMGKSVALDLGGGIAIHDDSITWGTVRSWMLAHSVPRVVAEDGEATSIDGVPCGNEALSFLCDVERVFL